MKLCSADRKRGTTAFLLVHLGDSRSHCTILKMRDYCFGYEPGVFEIASWQAGTMTPCRWDGKQLGTWHVLDFEAVVFHLEVQIGFAGHDQGFGCDRPQCRVKITVEYRIGSDVRVLPGP